MRQPALHTEEFADQGAEGTAGLPLHGSAWPKLSGAEEAGAEPGSRPAVGAGRLLVVCGLLLLPWLYVLATGLPDTATAAHWPVAWVGLDTMEAVGLIATGVLAAHGDRWNPLVATATATLLVIDAWFDTTTASVGSDLAMAAAMALGAELPLAALCVWLAVRALQQRR
ncbi:hypothetical protein ACFVW5_20810 [Streptomyces sp. NPDC058232]|uniref:hypothetical protein n=1 Tax=Streptomyces sp. NPDC058232 TaxID=3346393 RepID=UPI0036EE5641